MSTDPDLAQVFDECACDEDSCDPDCLWCVMRREVEGKGCSYEDQP